MKKDRNIPEEVRKTLGSLDGIHRAAPDGFFFTRLHARIRQGKTAVDGWERFIGWITRPAIAATGVGLILLVNGMLTVKQLRSNADVVEQTNLQQAVAEEYQLGIVTYYEYEKPEQ